MKAVEWILRQLRSLSPYLAVALLLPGGSIVAFLLWISAQNRAATDSEAIARAKQSAPPLLSTNPK